MRLLVDSLVIGVLTNLAGWHLWDWQTWAAFVAYYSLITAADTIDDRLKARREAGRGANA